MPDKPLKSQYDKARLLAQIIKHEGLEKLDPDDNRYKPYRDSLGVLTIGVGRNLMDRGLSYMECMFLLSNDVADAETDLDRVFPTWKTLTPLRQLVLLEMMFNLGATRFKSFRIMLSQIKAGNYSAAGDEMLNSVWARQVKDRAVEMADQMRRGQ